MTGPQAPPRPAPPRYRWRLIGTHITQLLGRDSTGRWLDELYAPAAMAAVDDAFRLTMSRRAAIRFTGTFAFAGKSYFAFESLHLPLVGRHRVDRHAAAGCRRTARTGGRLTVGAAGGMLRADPTPLRHAPPRPAASRAGAGAARPGKRSQR